jgi:hypothetical protein
MREDRLLTLEMRSQLCLWKEEWSSSFSRTGNLILILDHLVTICIINQAVGEVCTYGAPMYARNQNFGVKVEHDNFGRVRRVGNVFINCE